MRWAIWMVLSAAACGGRTSEPEPVNGAAGASGTAGVDSGSGVEMDGGISLCPSGPLSQDGLRELEAHGCPQLGDRCGGGCGPTCDCAPSEGDGTPSWSCYVPPCIQ